MVFSVFEQDQKYAQNQFLQISRLPGNGFVENMVYFVHFERKITPPAQLQSLPSPSPSFPDPSPTPTLHFPIKSLIKVLTKRGVPPQGGVPPGAGVAFNPPRRSAPEGVLKPLGQASKSKT